nr:type I restriction enzyme HsdR N-terminal domain-containing protein [Chromatium okenii]
MKSKDKVILVIECKASSINLTASAVLQATNYAAALGAEWAAVTNGRRWLLYHVTPKKGEEPIIDEIFDVELLDDNGISKDDIDSLYLLTEQALISGETIKTFHFFNCTSQEKIFQAIVSEPVVHVICEELQKLYKQEAGVLSKDINPSFIQELLVEMFINDELE